ncbi:TPA: cupin domain-containing protein [Escherichia coli]
MTNLKKRERAKTNASLISMVQRFSDITIMFAGLWLVCEVSGLSFLYMHLLVALITLVVFQMLGGITDFYRSWRGVRAATEFALLLQNWTLSVIFSAGLVAFNNDFDTQLKIWLAWYGLTSIGLVVCRSCIRIGAGWLRNHGYNKRMVAVAGDLAAGQMLMESFRNQPWLGFEVVGVYHDPKPGGVSNDWAGNLQQLVEDAKAGKIHNVYIAMQMCDGARVKKLVHQLADTTCSVLLIPDVFNTKNNYIHSESALVAAVGVEDIVIVQTKDAILVSKKSEVQDVKKIVQMLKMQERSEYLSHREEFRPWGKFDAIEQGDRYKVKKIVVKPGEGLSLRMHHHRSEHWIVLSGTAKVTLNNKTFLVTANESVYIPLGATYSLENPGIIPLNLIEVSSGDYLGEDDIVRQKERYKIDD